VPEEQIPKEDFSASEDLSYQEYPLKILETSERLTQNRKIKMCKVQSSHHTKAEATCEREEQLKAEFLNFFSIPRNLEGEIHFKGGMFVTPCFPERLKTLGNYVYK
jgi:hypothetical protein